MKEQEDKDICPKPLREDSAHSWHFDGDDPYIVCFNCEQTRDTLTGEIV